MERIQALIDKLQLQNQQQVSPAQLLLTVQLLQNELSSYQPKNAQYGTAKVSVTLPYACLPAQNVQVAVPEPVRVPEPATVVATVTEDNSRPVKHIQSAFNYPPVENEAHAAYQPPPSYSLRKPVVAEVLAEEEQVQPVMSHYSAPVTAAPFNQVEETPTLAQHITETAPKEVHELITVQKESLNDRLKQEKTEVVHLLKETPIKDLRKGIGINERFTFVNELFRGDNASYERSIKTINGFHILSEAEYWINRELKFKLGWNDTNETVQHFYQLVRRRFS
jgi:hypothetical protein